MLKLTSYLSKLNLGRPSCGSFNQTFGLHTSPSLYFHSSGANYSALKKRKSKADPGQVKAKEERRRRRLAKALRKMEKKDRLAKPLMECEIPISLHQERAERLRGIEVSKEEKEARILHMKDWARHTYVRNHNEIWKQDKILLTQQLALDELKKESISLYESAIQFDPTMIPISFSGPVATPPIKDYLQDGDYKDTTPTFKVIYEDTETFMKELLQRQRRKKKKVEEED